MALAPFACEAQVAVAERTGERDLADIRDGPEFRRRSFERVQRALDLSALVIDPFLDRHLGRAPAAFVNQQDAGIENSIAQRLQRQRRKARTRIWGNDLST